MRYKEASIDKLNTIESKSNQKQMKTAAKKESLSRNVSTKVQEKMDKVSNLQMQKVAVVDPVRGKLEEKQLFVSANKEEILKWVLEKPSLQKEKYA